MNDRLFILFFFFIHIVEMSVSILNSPVYDCLQKRKLVLFLVAELIDRRNKHSVNADKAKFFDLE